MGGLELLSFDLFKKELCSFPGDGLGTGETVAAGEEVGSGLGGVAGGPEGGEREGGPPEVADGADGVDGADGAGRAGGPPEGVEGVILS